MESTLYHLCCHQAQNISECIESAEQVKKRVFSYTNRMDNEGQPHLLKEWFMMILGESLRLQKEFVDPVISYVKEIEWATAQVLPTDRMTKSEALIQLGVGAQDAIQVSTNMKWDPENHHNNIPWMDAFVKAYQAIHQAIQEEHLFFVTLAEQEMAKKECGPCQVAFWKIFLQAKGHIAAIACIGYQVASDIHRVFMHNIVVQG